MTPQTIILPSGVTMPEPSRYIGLMNSERVNNHWMPPMTQRLHRQSRVNDYKTLIAMV